LGLYFAFTMLGQTVNEYQIKAAFIFNLAKFVEWPPTAFRNEKDPLRICVLGRDPFGSALGDAVGGKTVMGRSFAVSPLAGIADAANCQILFVSSSEKKRTRSIVGEIHTAGILTVGETDGFAAEGGMVNLKLDDVRVRVEINLEAATMANLRISSKVLNLAQIVKGKEAK
jgi:hypothetical protein